MSIDKFETDFVRRTIHTLKRYRGKYPLSQLINCTLGLIILPYEKRIEIIQSIGTQILMTFLNYRECFP